MRQNQQRTDIPIANTWTAVTVPIGATDFILAIEDETATFRVSVDNTIDASSAGLYIGTTGFYSQEGTNTTEITLYISASSVTAVVLQYN